MWEVASAFLVFWLSATVAAQLFIWFLKWFFHQS